MLNGPVAVPSYVNMVRLTGHNYLVAGAGQGIGRQAAHALAQAGATVACLDRDGDLAGAVADEVGGVAVVGDATRRDDVTRMVDEATGHAGRLDGLVDIIGMGKPATILDATDDVWDEQFDVNLRQAFLLAQAVGRTLRDGGNGGAMAFVASGCGLASSPRQIAYGAAKAALMSVVRTAAVELAPFGIRVNALSPGLILTPRVSTLFDDAMLDAGAANAPLGRAGLPSDMASVLLFLMSPLSAYVTGQTIVADGGVDVKYGYPLDASGMKAPSPA